MNLPFAPAILRFAAVLGMMVAWLVCTNHCGLLLWTGDAMASAPCCAGDAGSEDGPNPADHGVGCCKIKAPLAEKLTVPLVELASVETILGAPPLVPRARELVGALEPARGPPRAPTLLELVWESCQRSQAPPVAA